MNYLKAHELFSTAGVPKQIRQLLGRHDIKGIEISYGWLDQINFEVLSELEIFWFCGMFNVVIAL